MQLADLISPKDPRSLEVAAEIYGEREDLRQAFPAGIDDVEFRKWFASYGLLEYPERIGPFYPQVPPEHLRATGCGGTEAHTHLLSSIGDFETVCDIWELHGDRPIDELKTVFDFGCGCGRVMRWFGQRFPEIEMTGCDVRLAGIEWCRRHLSGTYLHTETEPPLPVETDSMDLVYALSLFSHFEKDSSRAWIRELARVCRPDGHMLVTTHGAFSLYAINKRDELKNAMMKGADTVECARQLERDNFLFYKPSQEWLESLDGPSDDYGHAFMTERFIREEWSDLVEIVAYVPAALFMFQDVYLLKPVR